jgi:predicted protein tyrosine phosphatase
MRALFVCRGNVCRSRVAEEVFRVLTWGGASQEPHEARSAGIDPDPGGRLIGARDVAWADVIMVMETEQLAYIRKRWPTAVRKVRVLDIEDVYQPEDEELRTRLTDVVRELLAAPPEPPVDRAVRRSWFRW